MWWITEKHSHYELDGPAESCTALASVEVKATFSIFLIQVSVQRRPAQDEQQSKKEKTVEAAPWAPSEHVPIAEVTEWFGFLGDSVRGSLSYDHKNTVS